MAPPRVDPPKVAGSVSLPLELDVELRDIATRTGVPRCYVIEECLRRSLPDILSLPEISGKRNRKFVAVS